MAVDASSPGVFVTARRVGLTVLGGMEWRAADGVVARRVGSGVSTSEWSLLHSSSANRPGSASLPDRASHSRELLPGVVGKVYVVDARACVSLAFPDSD